MDRKKIVTTTVALWITAASVAGQDKLLLAIVKAIGDVETGNIADQHKRERCRRGSHVGWYQMSEDLWYDTTIYRFKQGKRLHLYNKASDAICSHAYCLSALEMLCTRWFDIFGYYPTIQELANCYRSGLSATVKGHLREKNYGQRVENLTIKYMEKN